MAWGATYVTLRAARHAQRNLGAIVGILARGITHGLPAFGPTRISPRRGHSGGILASDNAMVSDLRALGWCGAAPARLALGAMQYLPRWWYQPQLSCQDRSVERGF
jgi:hypothetical protein